jgi:hypothetical protein
MGPRRRRLLAAAALAIATLGNTECPVAAPVPVVALADAADEDRLLALDPERISAADVRNVLARAPAPRVINLQGSLVWVTMQPFAQYLVAMGYPEDRLRNPADGTLSYSSFADSERLAGTLAWYYENEGMVPMLVGHSQGGMLAIRVLHDLAGAFHESIDVWNPMSDESEHRTTITDPADGRVRPVVGLKVPYAAALATGKLPRLLLGQWTMMGRLRAIPDSVDEFTGLHPVDAIAGTFRGRTLCDRDGGGPQRGADGHQSYRTADGGSGPETRAGSVVSATADHARHVVDGVETGQSRGRRRRLVQRQALVPGRNG